jgi:hypothetical protein
MSCERLESDPYILCWYIRQNDTYTFGKCQDQYRFANWWSIDEIEEECLTGYLGDYWWLDVTASSIEIAFRIGLYKILKGMEEENQHHIDHIRYDFKKYIHVVSYGGPEL